jgi:hypothetical protein
VNKAIGAHRPHYFTSLLKCRKRICPEYLVSRQNLHYLPQKETFTIFRQNQVLAMHLLILRDSFGRRVSLLRFAAGSLISSQTLKFPAKTFVSRQNVGFPAKTSRGGKYFPAKTR